jgi:hypothetical protein
VSVTYPYELGAAGLVIWGNPLFKNRTVGGTVAQFQSYFASTLGPTVALVKKRAAQCSATRCHAHGRCIESTDDGPGGLGCRCEHGFDPATNCAPAHMPPPRWWERSGGSVMAFSPKVALGRGLYPKGQMKGLPAYLELLDQLHKDGVTTLQLDTVYDCGSGYDPSRLFSGLAGSNYSAVNPNIGGDEEWKTLIGHAHRLNITVTSFWNAAYFWTGSPYVKQAEADIRAHGLDALPTNSPARWFRWSPHRARRTKPPDATPNSNGDWGWVWDPDVNASYLLRHIIIVMIRALD